MSDCPSIVCCPTDPFQTPIAETVTTYWNAEQCATVQCEDESDSATVCIAANTFSSSVSQNEANALALAEAESQAVAELSCSFSSTQEVCVDCPASGVGTTLIPVMTAADAPSGDVIGYNVVSAPGNNSWNAFTRTVGNTTDFDNPSVKLSYAFDAAVTATAYSVSGTDRAGTFKLLGSANGVDWTLLDTQELTGAIPSGAPQTFTLSAAKTYQHWQFYFVPYGWEFLTTCIVDQLTLYGTASSEVCESATRTSLISQADADNKAYAAALAAATAACAGSGSGSGTNSTPIVLPVGAWNEAYYAAAAPYPSIVNITQSGSISNVQVTLNDLSLSANGDSWQIMLQSPAGSLVVLWSDRHNGVLNALWTSILDITIDDGAISTIYPGPTVLVSGIYQPSNGGYAPALTVPSPAPQSGHEFVMSAFNGENPTGAWSLWVCSRLTAQITIAGGWSLNITTT